MKVYGTTWKSHLPAIAELGIEEIPVTDLLEAAGRMVLETRDPDDIDIVLELEVPESKLEPDPEAFFSPEMPPEDAPAPRTWQESLERYNSAMAFDIPPRNVNVLGTVSNVTPDGRVTFGQPSGPVKKFKTPLVTRVFRSIFQPGRELY